jgi:hypothetical protein
MENKVPKNSFKSNVPQVKLTVDDISLFFNPTEIAIEQLFACLDKYR